MFLLEQNQCNHFQRFFPHRIQTVSFSCSSKSYITRLHNLNCSIVIKPAVPLECNRSRIPSRGCDNQSLIPALLWYDRRNAPYHTFPPAPSTALCRKLSLAIKWAGLLFCNQLFRSLNHLSAASPFLFSHLNELHFHGFITCALMHT